MNDLKQEQKSGNTMKWMLGSIGICIGLRVIEAIYKKDQQKKLLWEFQESGPSGTIKGYEEVVKLKPLYMLSYPSKMTVIPNQPTFGSLSVFSSFGTREKLSLDPKLIDVSIGKIKFNTKDLDPSLKFKIAFHAKEPKNDPRYDRVHSKRGYFVLTSNKKVSGSVDVIVRINMLQIDGNEITPISYDEPITIHFGD